MRLTLPIVKVGSNEVQLTCYEIHGVWHVFAMGLGKRHIEVSATHDSIGDAFRIIRAKLHEYGAISCNRLCATKMIDKRSGKR